MHPSNDPPSLVFSVGYGPYIRKRVTTRKAAAANCVLAEFTLVKLGSLLISWNIFIPTFNLIGFNFYFLIFILVITVSNKFSLLTLYVSICSLSSKERKQERNINETCLQGTLCHPVQGCPKQHNQTYFRVLDNINCCNLDTKCHTFNDDQSKCKY